MLVAETTTQFVHYSILVLVHQKTIGCNPGSDKGLDESWCIINSIPQFVRIDPAQNLAKSIVADVLQYNAALAIFVEILRSGEVRRSLTKETFVYDVAFGSAFAGENYAYDIALEITVLCKLLVAQIFRVSTSR